MYAGSDEYRLFFPANSCCREKTTSDKSKSEILRVQSQHVPVKVKAKMVNLENQGILEASKEKKEVFVRYRKLVSGKSFIGDIEENLIN